MKKYVIVGLFLLSTSVSADWILGTIFNQTDDLVLDKAWNYRSSGKVRMISSLTNMLQKAPKLHRHSIFVQYHIDSHGLALSGHNLAGHDVDLFLDGQPSHSIEWERKKTKTITHFPQWCQASDGAYCARVIMRDGVSGTLVSKPSGAVHDNSRQVFDLYISGTDGQYRLSLVSA